MRTSIFKFGPFAMLVVSITCLLFMVTGCGGNPSVSYTDQMEVYTQEVANLVNQYDAILSEYGQSIQGLVSQNADDAQIADMATQLFEQMGGQLEQISSGLQSCRDSIGELKPEQGFVSAQNRYLEALDAMVLSTSDMINGMGFMRDPAAFYDGMSYIDSALSLEEESMSLFENAKMEYDSALESKEMIRQNVVR